MIQRNLLVAALVALSITLSACGGGGSSMFRGGTGHTGQMSSSGQPHWILWPGSTPCLTRFIHRPLLMKKTFI